MALQSTDDGSRLSFALDDAERRVDLESVASVRRGGRRVAQLLDLWVASLLPGDLLDLKFEIVAEDASGVAVRSAFLDGVGLTRGFVAIGTRRLWWDGPRDGVPHGLVARSVVVHGPPPTVRAPVTPPPTRPPAAVPALVRVLPAIAFRYPAVEWRLRTG
ncbi:MAG TPA: hypothetical protein VIF09_01360 [Polyangiaceae bacterium]